jgi:hypothetical protein
VIRQRVHDAVLVHRTDRHRTPLAGGPTARPQIEAVVQLAAHDLIRQFHELLDHA